MLDPNDSRTYTPENLEKLGQLLSAAMEGGDQQHAESIVNFLTKQRIKCSIKLDAASLKDGTKDPEFSVKVHIEDREQSGGAITLKVKPTDTVRDLKHKMFLKHGFPIEVQRWIIGKRLVSDKDTLKNLRVSEGTSLYLYLVSAKSIGLNKEDFEKTLLQTQQLMAQGHLGYGHLSMESTEYGTGGLSIPPTPQSANPPSRQRSMQSLGSLNQSSMNQQIPYNQQRSRDSQGSSLQGQGQILRSSRSVSSQIIDEDPAPELRPGVLERITNEDQQVSDKQGQNAGWTCEKCTFINQPTRPGCEICGANRPESYKIPEGYQLSEAEKQRIEKEKEMEKQAQQAAEERRPREITDDYDLNVGERQLNELLQMNDAMQQRYRSQHAGRNSPTRTSHDPTAPHIPHSTAEQQTEEPLGFSLLGGPDSGAFDSMDSIPVTEGS